ncbi:hypothetical protein [Moraxella sp. VT-16-12]|uniref:hypothetical protein n=1 Tax=Moraxella sp. VT-16-12 TaxID=2014877 RepID=UPI000B7C9848|nr:hypothetical protein [Moraxella sp. VT-16-12]TWV81508.1 hypothetical protein CEW93_007265 [Moraxella sp. VT-16-12]
MTTKTLKTLSTTELDILTAFGYQVSTWQNTHGDDASIVKIEYSDDTGDFEITTNKANQGRTRRVSRLTADIIHWASGQLDTLEYQGIYADKLMVAYQDNQFSIDLVPKPAKQDQDEQSTDDTPTNAEPVNDPISNEQDSTDAQS